MAGFFFVIGLEVKREFVHGALRDPRAAALPIICALGGMVAPGLLYLAINAGGDGAASWGSRWPLTSPSPWGAGAARHAGTGLGQVLGTSGILELVYNIWYSLTTDPDDGCHWRPDRGGRTDRPHARL